MCHLSVSTHGKLLLSRLQNCTFCQSVGLLSEVLILILDPFNMFQSFLDARCHRLCKDTHLYYSEGKDENITSFTSTVTSAVTFKKRMVEQERQINQMRNQSTIDRNKIGKWRKSVRWGEQIVDITILISDARRRMEYSFGSICLLQFFFFLFFEHAGPKSMILRQLLFCFPVWSWAA